MADAYRHWTLLAAGAVTAVATVACGGVAETPTAVPPPPVSARVAVDRAVATTGDVITYTVELDYAEGFEVELPEPGAEIAGFRIVDLGREPELRADGRVGERRWYRLRADFVGSYILPPITVAYTSPEGEQGELRTSEIFVEVESVLPEDGEATDIRDVKPLRRPEGRVPWWWIVPLMVAAVAAAAGWWAFARRSRAQRAAIAVPPHELAFRELDRLRRIDFSDLEELRAYYFSISEVLRAYIERRFGLNATDLTTEEILGSLDWLRQIGTADAERLGAFLTATDRVKFAAEVPQEKEIEETYEAALVFVESTRPRSEEISAATSPNDGQPTARTDTLNSEPATSGEIEEPATSGEIEVPGSTEGRRARAVEAS